mmetsp:Transcript_82899/g.239535  ORF Transcript_82899/g.239535 Transcript_82899/m.239535 type:complete len:254 (-) Transcript_82899:929-1690(-)
MVVEYVAVVYRLGHRLPAFHGRYPVVVHLGLHIPWRRHRLQATRLVVREDVLRGCHGEVARAFLEEGAILLAVPAEEGGEGDGQLFLELPAGLGPHRRVHAIRGRHRHGHHGGPVLRREGGPRRRRLGRLDRSAAPTPWRRPVLDPVRRRPGDVARQDAARLPGQERLGDLLPHLLLRRGQARAEQCGRRVAAGSVGPRPRAANAAALPRPLLPRHHCSHSALRRADPHGPQGAVQGGPQERRAFDALVEDEV